MIEIIITPRDELDNDRLEALRKQGRVLIVQIQQLPPNGAHVHDRNMDIVSLRQYIRFIDEHGELEYRKSKWTLDLLEIRINWLKRRHGV